MSKFTEFAQAVGADIKEIKDKQSSSLSISQAYGLFPTYNNFFLQVLEQNKFAEDPLVTKSQLPTSDIDELKKKVDNLVSQDSRQLLSGKINGSAWHWNNNALGKIDSGDWARYPEVTLKKGETYYIFKARGFFTYTVSLDKKRLIKKFTESDTLFTGEYVPPEDCILVVSYNPKNDKEEPKVFVGTENENRTDYTVRKDGTGDFSTLSEAVKSVGSGSKEKPKNIYIYSGEYDILQELGGDSFLNTVKTVNSERQGIEVPDYVNIVGIGDVRLKMDVPDDKTTRETSTRISVLNVWRHNTIKNIKITVRNTRYAVHDETNNQYANNDMKYIDCYFEHLGNKAGVWNSTQAYAAGMGSGGNYHFENCTFKSNILPFSMHDNFNVESNRVKITKCTFITGSGEDAIRFGSYGTGAKKSIVTIENCNIDKSVKSFEEQYNSHHGNHFAISGGGNTIVPYVNINSAGRKERVEFADEVRTLGNSSSTKITVGTPVKLVGTSIQPLGTNEPWLFYGVALDDIEQWQRGVIKYAGYIAKEDTGIGTLQMGQRIGLVNGRLAAVDSNDFIAYATDGNNILLK